MTIRIILLIYIGLYCQNIIGQEATVTDEIGQPLAGVLISTTTATTVKSTVTDLHGNANVGMLYEVDSFISISYLGYKEHIISKYELKLKNYIIQLTPDNYLFEEVVVLGRREVLQEEIPYQIASINAKEIASAHAQNTADALSQNGAVYVQKSQMGGGSPMIRGFEANRVLLVVDGIRMNNAIYRNGHLQNAITVDQAILERMDVIFGPNSLLYGSDALGGVVHFRTRSPSLSVGDAVIFNGQYYTRYASANNEKSAHVDFTIGKEKFGSLTSLTVSDFGDLRSGASRDDRFPEFGKRLTYQGVSGSGEDIEVSNEDPNLQVGTGYEQLDLLQKFLFVPDSEHRITASFQYSTSSNVQRYDNLSEIRNGTLSWAEWNYGPQQRLLAGIEYRNLQESKWSDQFVIIGAYQRIDEDRLTRQWENVTRQIQEEDVSVWSLTADASKALGVAKNITIDYGADFQFNDVNSSVSNKNIISGLIDNIGLSRYASDFNRYSGFGAFASLNGVNNQQSFRYQMGIRLSHVNYHFAYDRNDPVDWPEQNYKGINGKNTAFTWSVGSTYSTPYELRIRGIVSTAFRAPNIDDLAKIRVNNDEITFPNTSLQPERSFNAELGMDKQWQRVDIGATVFYTSLQDAIVRKKGTGPSGESQWITQNDTLIIVSNQNAQSAYIYGLSLQANYRNPRGLQIGATYNFTKGRERTNSGSQPLAHIPPTYGRYFIGWKNEKWDSKFLVRYNRHKPLSEFGGSVDNPDLATSDGTLGWMTLNIYGSYQLNEALSLSLALENISDRHYRTFGSGVSGAGRNVVISVRGKF